VGALSGTDSQDAEKLRAKDEIRQTAQSR